MRSLKATWYLFTLSNNNINDTDLTISRYKAPSSGCPAPQSVAGGHGRTNGCPVEFSDISVYNPTPIVAAKRAGNMV